MCLDSCQLSLTSHCLTRCNETVLLHDVTWLFVAIFLAEPQLACLAGLLLYLFRREPLGISVRGFVCLLFFLSPSHQCHNHGGIYSMLEGA